MSTPGITYYLSLITSQYQNSPKFLGWTGDALSFYEDARLCLESFEAAFDLDTAVGKQLDAVGAILGIGRVLNFQPTTGSPVLSDANYRLLLRARVAFDNWDGKLGTLQPIWQALFPLGSIYILDHQNMTITIIVMGTFSDIETDLITHGYIVPRPQAVLVNYVFGVEPFFGFNQVLGLIDGFDTGHWI